MSRVFGMNEALPLLTRWRCSGREAELLLKQSVTRQWSLADGVFQTADGRERGGAVRVVLQDGRGSLVTTAVPSADGLPSLLEQAALLAGQAAPDPHQTLAPEPPQSVDSSSFTTFQGPPPELPGAGTVQNLLNRLMDQGRRLAPNGIRFLRVWIRQGEVVTELSNTRGFTGHHRSGLLSLGLLLADPGGGTEPLLHEEPFTAGVDPDTNRFLETALARAGGLFGPVASSPVSTGTLVLTPEAAAPLLLALASRFVPAPHRANEDRLPPIGTRVAASGITLVDDGRHPRGLRSAPFDGEGTVSGTTVLVRDGILQSMVHDRRSASRAGTPSTGNAVRDSYREWPAPGLTTLVLRAHPDLGEDDLLGDTRRGFFAVEASPPDPDRLETGLLSVRLRGRLIRNGRLHTPAAPVRLQLPLDDLLPRLAAAAGQAKLIALDGCVETPLVRLDGVRLESI